MKKLRLLLWPFAVLYDGIMRLRNFLYDKKILRSARFHLPVICVGNLSVGGTGKTPQTEYLIRLLQPDYKVGVLSRGYKRKTKGFVMAGENATAAAIGDEPMQLHAAYPETKIAVCEDRLTGIPQLLEAAPDIQVLLLDDALQHRSVQAGCNILLTEYGHPFYGDFVLPAGNLRESRAGKQRAQAIIVTKCPPDLPLRDAQRIKDKIGAKGIPVFFSAIQYLPLTDFYTGLPAAASPKGNATLLVAAIARPAPIMAHLKNNGDAVSPLFFADHHAFAAKDIAQIIGRYHSLPHGHRRIVTTTKDAVKLLPFKSEFSEANVNMVVLPIGTEFLFGEGAAFDELVRGYIGKGHC
ncbi:MAG: tetraacyldisaccharide 4'-kinase [Edaphocola sp.]